MGTSTLRFCKYSTKVTSTACPRILKPISRLWLYLTALLGKHLFSGTAPSTQLYRKNSTPVCTPFPSKRKLASSGKSRRKSSPTRLLAWESLRYHNNEATRRSSSTELQLL